MKTRAAVLHELNCPLIIEELEIPELLPGQVLVDIAFSGVCHTQLSEVRGRRGVDRFLPHTLGHEASGTVLAVGAEVTKAKVGDQVVLSWIKGSGAECPSTTYLLDDRKVNSGAVTTFMERAVVSENRCTLLPPGVPLKEAALLGCAIPTGAGIIVNTLKVQAGQSVAVIGVGGIGMASVMMAAAHGATPIIAVDISAKKLSQALNFGATHTVDSSQVDALATIREMTDGKGVDYAIEAVGKPQTMELAFSAVRFGGGTAVLAGNLSAGERISIDPFDLIKGKHILGTWGGETKPDIDIPKYGDLYRSGRLPLERMITHTYSLDQINAALDDLEAGRILRALIEFG